jgi:two-component system C4-dicarboxylate transport response regulator DctD
MTDGQIQLFPVSAGKQSYHTALHDFEKDLLLQALRLSHGNASEAARQLDLPRRSLYRRLQILGIDASAFRTK